MDQGRGRTVNSAGAGSAPALDAGVGNVQAFARAVPDLVLAGLSRARRDEAFEMRFALNLDPQGQEHGTICSSEVTGGSIGKTSRPVGGGNRTRKLEARPSGRNDLTPRLRGTTPGRRTLPVNLPGAVASLDQS